MRYIFYANKVKSDGDHAAVAGKLMQLLAQRSNAARAERLQKTAGAATYGAQPALKYHIVMHSAFDISGYNMLYRVSCRVPGTIPHQVINQLHIDQID